MISDTLKSIQKEFQNNWILTSVMYGSQNFAPNGDEWIILDIVPLGSNNTGLTTKLIEKSVVFISCFSTNQTQASKLGDEVSKFIQNRVIDGITIGPYRLSRQGAIVGQSDTKGSYYIKLVFDMETVCSV